MAISGFMLQRIIDSRKLSDIQVSEKLGMSINQFQNIITGIDSPSDEMINRICNAIYSMPIGGEPRRAKGNKDEESNKKGIKDDGKESNTKRKGRPKRGNQMVQEP